MRVSVMKLGQGKRHVDLPAGTSVEGAIREAGLTTDGYMVTRDAISISFSAEVYDGDILLLAPKVTGGR